MALPRIMDNADLLKFRTRVCQRWIKGSKCSFGDKCQYSHDLIWPRRPLWEVNYSETLCAFTAEDADKCPYARLCPNSHTEVEALYHPNVYKSKLCREFHRTGKCARYYCPYAHGHAELRIPGSSSGGSSNKSAGHELENLSPLSDTPSDSSKATCVKALCATAPAVDTGCSSVSTSDECVAGSSSLTSDDSGVIYVQQASIQFPAELPSDPPCHAKRSAPFSYPATLMHPNCSPTCLIHLCEMFDEPLANSPLPEFPLMEAWRVIVAMNRRLHLAEINRSLSLEAWKPYVEGSLLAFVAPERVAYWSQEVLGVRSSQAVAPPDDMKAMTWSAFMLLYISQYGVHPFAPSANCALYMLLGGRPDLALSERCMDRVLAAFADSTTIEPCAPQLVRGLEMRPSQRGSWNQILQSYARFFPFAPFIPSASSYISSLGGELLQASYNKAAAAVDTHHQQSSPRLDSHLRNLQSLSRTSTGEESDLL